jgi:hypothetical protein
MFFQRLKNHSMKKKNIYTACIVLFVLAVIAITIRYDHKKVAEENKDYALLERKGALANSDEWKKTKRSSDSLLALIKDNPTDSNRN